MGAMQRRKGAAFERFVSNTLKTVFPASKRGLGQTRAAGEVPDVDAPGYWPECKHQQRTNPRAALAQAIEASGASGRVPFAVCKDNGEAPFVTLRLTDFVELLYGYHYYDRGSDCGAGPKR